MAARRRRDPATSGFYPRDKHGRFVSLVDYRPRDKHGRFKKLPKKLSAAIEAAKRERYEKELAEQSRLAAERRERARNAALAGAAKRRRIRREAEELAALEERQAEARREFEKNEAERRRKIAEDEALKASERRLREETRKERAKRKRKERREREDAEIERLREQQKEIAEAEKLKLEEDRRSEKARHEQAVLDAEARAEEERARKALEEYARGLREGMEVPEAMEPPQVPEPGEPVEPPTMEGALVTPEEIIELALIELRDKTIAEGKLERTRTDSTLVRNVRTGSLGQAFRVEVMLRQEGLAEDLAEIAADVAEQIMGVDRGARVYVSILLTEWGSADGFVGSIDKVVAWGVFGTLVQSWQGVSGALTPEAVRRGVLKVFRDHMRHSPRSATLVEGIVIRGYKPGSMTVPR